MRPEFVDWITRFGYWGLAAGLMLEILALPIPGETLLTFTGYLIFKGRLSLLPAFLCALTGAVLGITLSYGLGRSLGHRVILRHGARVGLTHEKLERFHDWYRRTGKWTITIGYFIPGVRHLTGLMAGALELEPRVFALFAYLGSVLWVSSFLALGYYLGEGWRLASERFRMEIKLGSVAVVALAVLYVAIILIQRHRHPHG